MRISIGNVIENEYAAKYLELMVSFFIIPFI